MPSDDHEERAREPGKRPGEVPDFLRREFSAYHHLEAHQTMTGGIGWLLLLAAIVGVLLYFFLC